MEILFLTLGALGILAMIGGVLSSQEKHQDMWFILAGALLLIYSFYRGDLIFFILQLIFMAVALFELIHLIHTKKRSLWRRWLGKK